MHKPGFTLYIMYRFTLVFMHQIWFLYLCVFRLDCHWWVYEILGIRIFKKISNFTYLLYLMVKIRIREGLKKVCKITHLLLTHPPSPQVLKKTKKRHVVFGIFSSFGTKKNFEVFSPCNPPTGAINCCHPSLPLTTDAPQCRHPSCHPRWWVVRWWWVGGVGWQWWQRSAELR